MRNKLLKWNLTALLIFVFGTSCKDGSAPAEPSILGTWEINQILYTVSDSASNVVLFDDTSIYGAGENVVDFQANNMYISTKTDGTVVQVDTGYYLVNNGTLNLAETPDMAYAAEHQIETLTHTNLKLTYTVFLGGRKSYEEITGKRK